MEAASVSPPAWSTRSSIVVLSAYWYTPGKLTSPSMVNVRSPFISNELGINKTSFLRKGISATVPSIIPSTSTDKASIVRSSFWRCITARLRKASSRNPSAALINWRTVLILPSIWYCPGWNTAPRISAILEKRGIIESTYKESPSFNRKPFISNSPTVYTEYSRPLLRISRTLSA